MCDNYSIQNTDYQAELDPICVRSWSVGWGSASTAAHIANQHDYYTLNYCLCLFCGVFVIMRSL